MRLVYLIEQLHRRDKVAYTYLPFLAYVLPALLADRVVAAAGQVPTFAYHGASATGHSSLLNCTRSAPGVQLNAVAQDARLQRPAKSCRIDQLVEDRQPVVCRARNHCIGHFRSLTRARPALTGHLLSYPTPTRVPIFKLHFWSL